MCIMLFMPPCLSYLLSVQHPKILCIVKSICSIALGASDAELILMTPWPASLSFGSVTLMCIMLSMPPCLSYLLSVQRFEKLHHEEHVQHCFRCLLLLPPADLLVHIRRSEQQPSMGCAVELILSKPAISESGSQNCSGGGISNLILILKLYLKSAEMAESLSTQADLKQYFRLCFADDCCLHE